MVERPLSRNEQIAVEKRNRMSEIEAEYLRAKEYEKSAFFVANRMKALEKIRSILRMGTVSESEALLIVGRLQQLILDTFFYENVISEYESLKKSVMEAFPK